jgi:hypothetical protein
MIPEHSTLSNASERMLSTKQNTHVPLCAKLRTVISMPSHQTASRWFKKKFKKIKDMSRSVQK